MQQDNLPEHLFLLILMTSRQDFECFGIVLRAIQETAYDAVDIPTFERVGAWCSDQYALHDERAVIAEIAMEIMEPKVLKII